MKKILLIRIPQTDKEDLREKVSSYQQEPHIIFSRFFEQLLINFHELFSKKIISLEVHSSKQHITFYAYIEAKYSQLLRGQIYAMYPTCEIEIVDDYLDFAKITKTHNVVVAKIKLEKSDIFPIKKFEEFKKDSMAGVLSILSKTTKDEEVCLQIIISPQPDNTWFNFKQHIKKWSNKFHNILRIKYYFKQKGMQGITAEQKTLFEEKNSHKSYNTSLHVAYWADKKSPINLHDKLKVLFGAIYQFNTTDFNRFKANIPLRQTELIKKMQKRELTDSYVLCEKELATVFHLPNEEEIPNVVHVASKKSDPPETLPTEGDVISFFATTNFHNQNFDFGIKTEDRRRHFYAVGKSGSGKSKLLELLIRNDLKSGRGLCVLDPHGDLVDSVLRHMPENRINDVVLIDPSDTNFPVAFNLLEDVPPDMRVRVTIGIIDIFKKLFGTNWTTRLEHVLRYTLLALLENKNTTILSVLKMLSDKNYRQKIVSNINDSVVKNFWVNEFAAWSEKFDNEAITPLLNKVGQFVSTELIRNIVGQPKNSFSIRKIMDEGKILLVKLPKGILGEENSQLLGAMMVTKIYQSAMSRADTSEEQRRDFYLYVDEFQNFATDTFGEILSEARKYRLNLIIAHQFLGQLEEKIRKTVFGNVGTMLSFRVGSEDAQILENEFAPIFKKRDFVNLAVQDFYIKMLIDGESKDAFSAKSLFVKYPEKNFVDIIRETNRKHYALPREKVEEILQKWNEDRYENNFLEMKFETPLLD